VQKLQLQQMVPQTTWDQGCEHFRRPRNQSSRSKMWELYTMKKCCCIDTTETSIQKGQSVWWQSTLILSRRS